MKITVLLFATLRRSAGTESVDLDLAEGATAGDVLAELAARDSLRDLIERLPLRVAVNREYVPESTALAAGDEVAVVPPVSGGARPSAIVTAEPLSVDRVRSQVSRPEAGATVIFVGSTRDTSSLEYEAYREMAEERMADILEACIGELRLEAAAAEHRVGTVPLSEPSVIVAVSAPHRAEAFAGARMAIDRIKEEAPIWKIEAGDDASVSELRHLRSVPASPADAPVMSHLDSTGAARMVDVSGKPVSDRRARAEGEVRMSPGTARAVARGEALKGDVLGTARIAAIQAAKRTSELIPLAHPLPLTHVDVDFGIDEEAGRIEVVASAQTADRTGVEMEAITAVALAALTIYDMVKGLERGVEIGRIRLLEKSGGRQDWSREGER